MKDTVTYKDVDGKKRTGPAYDTEEWHKRATKLALCYAPQIIPCKHCQQPVVEGYCCSACGSSSPR